MGPSAIHDRSTDDVVALIIQELDDLKIGKLSNESLIRSEALARALSKGQPVSALRKERTDLQARVEGLRQSLSNSTIDQAAVKKEFFEIRNCMIETPSTCAEIINAGFIHRYQSVLPQILNGLAGPTVNDYVPEHKKTINQTDRLLKVSLQATEIHELFL